MHDPTVTRPVVDPEQRFWSYVTPTGFCWLWDSSRSHGYGSFNLRWKRVRAHRYAYEILVGPIPEGLVLDHLCRNTLCVNPDHLEPVTQGENARRGHQKIGPREVCAEGHPLTADNIYSQPSKPNARSCRICRRNRKHDRVTCGTCGKAMNRGSAYNHRRKMHPELEGANNVHQ